MLEEIQHQMGMWQLYFHLQPGFFLSGDVGVVCRRFGSDLVEPNLGDNS